MISAIEGKLVQLSIDAATIQVTHGISYDLTISFQTYEALKGVSSARISLHTHMQFQEKQGLICLYGFYAKEEREVFHLLQTVKDVGASFAMRILSPYSYARLSQYITSEDKSALLQIKGVGNRTAERLIVDLKDKLSSYTSSVAGSEAISGSKEIMEEAISALVQLGIKPAEAMRGVRKALAAMSSAEVSSLDTEELTKRALSMS